MLKTTVAFMGLLVSAIVAKADDLRLGVPAYAGTGCPANSASVTLSEDRKLLSILFDSFTAESGGDSMRQIDWKSCNLAVPVHIPNGFSVSIFQVDYRGFTFVPSGGRAQLSATYFFNGASGSVRASKLFVGPTQGEYLFSNNLQVDAMVWSPCGADTIMRVNAKMIAQTNSMFEQTAASVDSADVSSGIIYHLQLRSCR